MRRLWTGMRGALVMMLTVLLVCSAWAGAACAVRCGAAMGCHADLPRAMQHAAGMGHCGMPGMAQPKADTQGRLSCPAQVCAMPAVDAVQGVEHGQALVQQVGVMPVAEQYVPGWVRMERVGARSVRPPERETKQSETLRI